MMGRSLTRYLKVSPRKVRQVIDLVRGHEVESALGMLRHLNKGASRPIQKAILAAVDSARKRSETKTTRLVISRIMADEGPTKSSRRFRPASMGRAVRIRKRQSHLLVEVDAANVPTVAVATDKSQRAALRGAHGT